MTDDEYEDSVVGTPQGRKLSPLLANIMLNELDKETEKRGLNFVRYADDCIIMVVSEMSANRVMRNISRFIEEKLGLKVNMTKSKVDRPNGGKYLGFGFCFDSRANQCKAKPHAKSVAKYKKRMKKLTCLKYLLQTADVYMETLENSTESPIAVKVEPWMWQLQKKDQPDLD